VVVDANAALHDLFGYEHGELRGRDLLELTATSEDLVALREHLQTLAEGRRSSVRFDRRCRHRDGSPLWLRVYLSPYSDGASGTRLALGIVEDLSEIRERERELTVISEFHRALLDTAVDAMVTIDEKGRVETFNPAAERLFGYAASEVVGRNVSMLMPRPYRDEHDRYLRAYRETGRRAIIGVGREVAARRKDGSEFPIDLAVSEAVVDGRRIFMGTIRDISARRAAEAEILEQRDFLQQLFDIAPGIILVLDASGRIVRYNRYLEELIGHRLAELQGRDAIDALVAPEARGAARERLGEWRSGDGARDVEVPILAADGGERQVTWSVAPHRDAAGTVVTLLAIGVDVTDRKRLQEELQHSQRIEALGQLAAGVAHDFNTLLGSILGYSELLLERSVDGKLRRAAHEIRASAERGAALARRLLAFGRRRRAASEHLDLNGLLAGMDNMLGRLIGASISLRLEPTPHPVWVHADPGLVEQVVVNLVLNAVDAITGPGRIVVAVRDDGSDRVALVVSDTGCGMTDEVRRQIFEPFFTTKPGKGTGLGLSTVSGIVQQNGGSIRVDSRPGAGTTFTLLLPRSRSSPPRAADAAGVAADAPAAAGGRESVLVVEDDEIFRGLICEVLAGAGYDVRSAATASEGLAALASGDGNPRLAICDVGLPDLDGNELAHRLRASAVAVLLMSGHDDDLRGGDDLPFLAKPFRNQQLLQKVREVLDAPGGVAPRG
jgi:PAS domain S-box-containing protein